LYNIPLSYIICGGDVKPSFNLVGGAALITRCLANIHGKQVFVPGILKRISRIFPFAIVNGDPAAQYAASCSNSRRLADRSWRCRVMAVN
jgi:hypothetical protein